MFDGNKVIQSFGHSKACGQPVHPIIYSRDPRELGEMIVQVKSLSNNNDILSGSVRGTQLLGKLLENVKEPEEPEVLYLDFSGVAAATASFLRDGPLAFRAVVRARGSKLYPVMANVAEPIVEDLEFILSRSNDAVLCCELSNKGRVTNVRLVGRLEEKQLLTYNLIRKFTKADAGKLRREANDDDVGVTAWNNRLAALSAKGLIMEVSNGRRKQFRIPVVG